MRLIPRRRTLKTKKFDQRWQALQQYCASRKTWPQAVTEADNLLCEALKKRGYKGKTTGERLVAAQHELSDNEAAWFGHKLRQKLTDGPVGVGTGTSVISRFW